MKLRHPILIAVGVVVLAVAGGLLWLYSSLDSLVKTAIEQYGPEITQVSVQVARVTLAPTDGKGSIQGLRLGNPKEFSTGTSLKAGEISLQVDPASLASDVIVIREVVIQSPEVTYESSQAGNNLETIQKNVEAYVARLGNGKKADSAPKKKFIIENLYIRDGRVNVNTALTAGKTLSSGIPNLHLRDIGKKSNGATAGDVTKQVWDALVRSTGSAVSSVGGAIKNGAKSIVEGAKRLFK